MASFTAVLEENFERTSIIGKDQVRDDIAEEVADQQLVPPKQYGLPIFASTEQAVTVLAKLVQYRAWREAQQGIAVEYDDLDRYKAEELVNEWTEDANGRSEERRVG